MNRRRRWKAKARRAAARFARETGWTPEMQEWAESADGRLFLGGGLPDVRQIGRAMAERHAAALRQLAK